MKKKILLLAGLVLLFGCQKEIDNEKTGGKDVVEVDNSEVIPGWIRVKLKENAPEIAEQVATRGSTIHTETELDVLAAKYSATQIRRVFPDGGRFEQRRRDAGLHLWYDIYYEDDAPVTRAMNDFKLLEDIAVVEPLAKETSDSMFDAWSYVASSAEIVRPYTSSYVDPYIHRQWYLNNDGSRGSLCSVGCDVNAFAAWESGVVGNPAVVVAIIDHGIQTNHIDLTNNIWKNTSEVLNSTIDNDGNGYAGDYFGYNFMSRSGTMNPGNHGTHVAGVIGAMGNNVHGIAGIAGGKVVGGAITYGARLMGCQILDYDETGKEISGSHGAEALVYAADNGAVISQNSWGRSSTLASLEEAVNYFVRYAGLDEYGNQEGPMMGGIVIASAGNSADRIRRYPASYDNVMSVAALHSNFQKASYSNWSQTVTICAPGGESNSISGNDKYKIYSTITGHNYGYLYGTSMATPLVSGVAALVVEKFGVGQPGFTNDMLWEILVKSVNSESVYNANPSYGGLLGSGLIDAGKAVNFDLSTLDNQRN